MGFRQIRAPAARRNPAPLHWQHLSCSDSFHSVACERNCFKVCKAFAACCCRQNKTIKELLPGDEKTKIPLGGEGTHRTRGRSGAGGAGFLLWPSSHFEISQARCRRRVWPCLLIPPCAPMRPRTRMVFTRWGFSFLFRAFGVGPREGLLKAAALTVLPSD